MRLHRRNFLRLSAAVAVLPHVSPIANAQAYPNRYVRIVVPFAAGGAADPIARLIASRLSDVWGVPVVIENKGGAAGNVGAQMVAQSAPDGHTLLLGVNTLATKNSLYPSLGYDPVADLAPVTLVCLLPSLLVVPNSSPAKSLGEFIDYAKATGGKLSFASVGTGTASHLSGELLKRMAGIQMTHVPYRAGAALNDLIPGRIDAMFGVLPGTLPQVQSGIIRGIAVTSAQRSPFAPEIPTIAESGFPGFDASGWYALFLPAKTPTAIIQKVHNDGVAALMHPGVKQKFEEIAAEVKTSSPAELATYLKSEINKWGPIINAAGIRAD